MTRRYPDGVETRTAATELRVAPGRTLHGLAAVWDKPTQIGGFIEVIRRNAFSSHLASGADVFLLGHHDFAQPLARSGNGSLKLTEGAEGLEFEATLPATRAADDILELARTGTLAGASIGFRVAPGGEHWPTRDKRELRQLELIEVSAVTLPAYAGTSVSARSLVVTDNRARLHRLKRELM